MVIQFVQFSLVLPFKILFSSLQLRAAIDTVSALRVTVLKLLQHHTKRKC